MHVARDISGAIGVGVLIVTLFILFYKFRNLGTGKGYFIASVFALTVIEGYSVFQRGLDHNFNAAPIHVVGIEFVVFALLLLYFHRLLVRPVFRRINTGILLFFVAQYFLSAFLIETFFTTIPFNIYFFGVLSMFASIVLVLWQTFNSKKVLALGKYFPFWACISTLIIFIGALPLIIARYYTELSATIFYTTLFLVHVLGHIATVIGALKAKDEY